MGISVNAHFDDRTKDNIRLLIRAETAFPDLWISRYKKNVAPLTPRGPSGWLRRSIITRKIPNGAEVTWRADYAAAQNVGQFVARRTYLANISPTKDRRGPYIWIKAGQTYRFNSVTGTPHFANIAFKRTNDEVPAMARELGLTK